MKFNIKIVAALVAFAFIGGFFSNVAKAESLSVTASHTAKVAKHKAKKHYKHAKHKAKHKAHRLAKKAAKATE